MLPRNFTEEQQMFRDAYRRFLSAEIVPHMEKWREAGIVDREAFRKAGEQGFLMVWPDEQYGGMGDDDFRFEQVIIEEAPTRVSATGTTRCTVAWSAPTSRASAALSSASASCPAACGASRSSPLP
jgi:alkylation response protein AidB-like acyl-CoA dehydrogenase